MAQLAVMAVMAVGELYKGKQAQKLKEREAQAYEEAAGRRMVAMQAETAEEVRKRELMYSRALAVVGASGADPSGSGIQPLLSDLNAEGDYRILSTIYTGQTDAEGLRFRAEAARREGDAAKDASYVNAVTSAVSGYVGMGGKSGDLSKFTTTAQMARGLDAATAERAEIGEVWDEATKKWVKKAFLGGTKIPGYGDLAHIPS